MGKTGSPWFGVGRGELEAMLDESQMTGAGAIQCRYPMEFNLEKHFLLRKKVPFKKKVS